MVIASHFGSRSRRVLAAEAWVYVLPTVLSSSLASPIAVATKRVEIWKICIPNPIGGVLALVAGDSEDSEGSQR